MERHHGRLDGKNCHLGSARRISWRQVVLCGSATFRTYLSNPLRIFAVWEGGMAFYGAIFGVVITILLLARRLRFSILDLLDVAAIFAVVGQFFGRIGNIINGDVLGFPTKLPWGFIYANPNSFAPRNDIAYQPAAVYEALIDILLFGLLWWQRKKLKPGILFSSISLAIL